MHGAISFTNGWPRRPWTICCAICGILAAASTPQKMRTVKGKKGAFISGPAEEIRALLGAEAAEVLLAEYGVRERGKL